MPDTPISSFRRKTEALAPSPLQVPTTTTSRYPTTAIEHFAKASSPNLPAIPASPVSSVVTEAAEMFLASANDHSEIPASASLDVKIASELAAARRLAAAAVAASTAASSSSSSHADQNVAASALVNQGAAGAGVNTTRVAMMLPGPVRSLDSAAERLVVQSLQGNPRLSRHTHHHAIQQQPRLQPRRTTSATASAASSVSRQHASGASARSPTPSSQQQHDTMVPSAGSFPAATSPSDVDPSSPKSPSARKTEHDEQLLEASQLPSLQTQSPSPHTHQTELPRHLEPQEKQQTALLRDQQAKLSRFDKLSPQSPVVRQDRKSVTSDSSTDRPYVRQSLRDLEMDETTEKSLLDDENRDVAECFSDDATDCISEDAASFLSEKQERDSMNDQGDDAQRGDIREMGDEKKEDAIEDDGDGDGGEDNDDEDDDEILAQNEPNTRPLSPKLIDAAGKSTMKGLPKHHSQTIDRTLSMTESDVGSIDGLPTKLQSRWMQVLSRQNMLQSLDGIPEGRQRQDSADSNDSETQVEDVADKTSAQHTRSESFFDKFNLNFLFGAGNEMCAQTGVINNCNQDYSTPPRRSRWKDEDDTLALLACANIIHREDRVSPAMPTSLVRAATERNEQESYPESLYHLPVDPRLTSWIHNQFRHREKPAKDGTYHLGNSRTVIAHEIVRGNWTWCTAWSPDGTMLAVATENHHLAVIDTSSSTVWRVRHDQKISGPARGDTTHSIRAIAWGINFIAIGGTGNAVSILSTTEPYPVLHKITKTGFVGSLDWKIDSSDLVIGSRLGKAMVVRVRSIGDARDRDAHIEHEVLHTVERKGWVNCVAFGPRGKCFAVGDAGGHLLIYNYLDERMRPVEVSLMKTFKLEDSVLCIEWSPDGKWLYAGGEDFNVTVVETCYWEIVHRVRRDRWVQCIAASRGGTHVAVGGVSSEISLLETGSGWDSVMGVELNGLVPLSAQWHPQDQYLALTGQTNSILVVETTNARHVHGHHLHSISPILAIEFSPDGRMAVVGNVNGVVTIFNLSGSTFETAYEIVVAQSDRLSIKWSSNGQYIVIGSTDYLMIVGNKNKKRHHRQRRKLPPNASGFSIRKIFRDLNNINAVSIDFQSQFIAVSGEKGTWILDANADFALVRVFTAAESIRSTAWSPDGRFLAFIGHEKVLTLIDTTDDRVERWRTMFAIRCGQVGRTLAWAPIVVGGLLYLAFGGDSKEITIMEIRSSEGTWETVLRIPRPGAIYDLDWNIDGLLSAAISNGTVSIIDLGYLQTGVAVNEMDYNWQRQALTCFAEIRRNRGISSMSCVRWIPSAPGSDSLIALGGTDGEVEIIDLTERQRCRGFGQKR